MKLIILFSTLLVLATSVLRADPKPVAQAGAPAKAPFRLVWKSYDGNPKSDDPKKFSFQIDINKIDLRQPSEFLKLGDQLPGTDFKVGKFTFKERINPLTHQSEDVSELMLVNIKSGKMVVLIYNQVLDVSGSE